MAAGNFTWDASGNGTAFDGAGTWNTTSARWWTGNGDVAWTTSGSDSATFGKTTGRVLPYRVTLGSNIAAAGITFATQNFTIAPDAANLYSLAVGSGGIAVTSSATIGAPLALAAAQTWTVSGSQSLTLGGPVSGSFNLTLAGGGTVILANSSSNSGPMLIGGGTLRLQATPTLPSAVRDWNADTLSGSNGAAITTWKDSLANKSATPFSSAPTLVTAAINGHNAVAFNGTNQALQVAAADNPISAAAAFTVALVFKPSASGASGNQWNLNTGLIDAEQGTLTNDWGLAYNSANQVGGGIGNPDTTLYNTASLNSPHVVVYSWDGSNGRQAVSVDGAVTSQLTTATAARNSYRFLMGSVSGVSGQYFGGQIAEVEMFTTALASSSAANVTCSLAQKYGIATIASITGNSLLPVSTPLTVGAGATLDLGGCSQELYSLDGGGTVINSNISAVSVLTLTLNGGTTTLAPTLVGGGGSGAIALLKAGSGTLVLANSNSHTGGTSVRSGLLQVAAAAAVPDNTPLAVSGGTFDLGGYSKTTSAAVSFQGGTMQNGAIVNTGLPFDAQAGAVSASLQGPAGMNKTGGGVLFLTNSNTFSGPTAITGGTLLAVHPLALQNSTVTTSLSGALSFAAGNTGPVFGGLAGAGTTSLMTLAAEPVTLHVGGNGANSAFGGNLSGPGSLVKQGLGTLALNAPQSYTGPTVIDGGTLQLAGLTSGTAGVKIMATGDSITEGNPIYGAAYRGPLYNLLNTAGYNFQYVGPHNSNPASLPTAPVDQTYHAGYSGWRNSQILSGMLPINQGGSGWLDSYKPSLITLLTGTNNNQTDVGAAISQLGQIIDTVHAQLPGTMLLVAELLPQINGTNSWLNSYNSQLIKLVNSKQAAGNKVAVVDLNTNFPVSSGLSGDGVHPSTVGYTWMAQQWFSAITASGSGGSYNLLPVGTALTIATGAVLDVGGGSQQVASLSGGGLLTNSSTNAAACFTVGDAGSTTFGGAITESGAFGSLSLVKVGSGTLTLTGSGAYSGGTVVNAGRLVVDGALTGPVTVNGGGSLAGSGSLESLTIVAGGHVAPGNSPGTLQLSGSLVLASGAVIDCDLDTPAASDRIFMPGGLLSLNGQQFADFNFTPLGGFGAGSYTLIAAGSISGNLGANTSGTIAGYAATLSLQGNDLVLNVVPEPASLTLLAASAIVLLGRAGRRRKQAA